MNTLKLATRTVNEVDEHIEAVTSLIAAVFDAVSDRVITDAEHTRIQAIAERAVTEGEDARHYAGRTDLELSLAVTWMTRGTDTRRFHDLERDRQDTCGEVVDITAVRRKVAHTKTRRRGGNHDSAA